MNGPIRPLSLALFAAWLALPGGQETGPAPRLIEARTNPVAPAFGETFVLNLRVRVAPGTTVLFPDTLAAAEAVRSVATGSWHVEPASGDSVDVVASYPLVGLDGGTLRLPGVDLLVRATPGAAVVPLPGAGAGASVDGGTPRLMPLGTVEVRPHRAMVATDTVLSARPVADVVGGSWSLWAIIAAGLASAAAIGGVTAVAPRWGAAARAAAARPGSAREAAIRELDSVLAAGAHRDGRIDEFYAATTGVLRRFAATRDPDCSACLTSTELLRCIVAGRDGARVDALRPVVGTAERVKFGLYRPTAEAAERDWKTVRDWIGSTPDA